MAELIEQLAARCGFPLKTQGALRLIRREDCGKVIEECQSRNVLILGIEAFKLEGDRVVPDTDLIADFSELASKEWNIACLEAVRSAEVYLGEATGQTDLWFDFSLRQR